MIAPRVFTGTGTSSSPSSSRAARLHAWARMTDPHAMAHVTPVERRVQRWRQTVLVQRSTVRVRAMSSITLRGARRPRRRRRRGAGRADGGAAARPPRARRCWCSSGTPSPIRCPARCTWTTRCSGCCRTPGWPTRVLAAQPPDGGAPAARRRGTGCSPSSAGTRTPACTAGRRARFVHQPDLEEVLAAAAAADRRHHRRARRRGHRPDPGRRRRDRRRYRATAGRTGPSGRPRCSAATAPTAPSAA